MWESKERFLSKSTPSDLRWGWMQRVVPAKVTELPPVIEKVMNYCRLPRPVIYLLCKNQSLMPLTHWFRVLSSTGFRGDRQSSHRHDWNFWITTKPDRINRCASIRLMSVSFTTPQRSEANSTMAGIGIQRARPFVRFVTFSLSETTCVVIVCSALGNSSTNGWILNTVPD